MSAVLTDRRPAKPPTHQEVDAIRRAMHAGKVAYPTHHAAHRASELCRQGGRDVGTPYRCLFGKLPGDEPHYHLGHTPSMHDLARIALYVRFGAQ